jgi:hypothetical protein
LEGDNCVLCRWGADNALLDGVDPPGAAVLVGFTAGDAVDLIEGVLALGLEVTVAFVASLVGFT